MTNYTPNPIQVETLTDFTGGLNYRADAFQLHGAESPDMLNVDLDPRGGFSLRDGVTLLNSSALSATPKNIWAFATSTGTQQVMVHNSTGTTNQFAYSTGGNFTNVTPDALACTGIMRACTFKDLCLIQRDAQQVAVKWTGAAATVLGTAFNDNFASPSAANMPKAKCIAAHSGSVWVANTVETGTAFPSRVRWSHPNQPMDFRTDDYIDIDVGHDGDAITALVPFGDRLLVFKANSTHVIYGTDWQSYGVQEVSSTVGAISQEAVVATEYGVYFFSWPDGLMHYDGSGPPQWAFERLWPAINDARIASTNLLKITVGWLNRRVWVSVPWEGSSTNARTFVLDPSLTRRGRGSSRQNAEGGWTAYDLPLGPMLSWQPPNTGATYLACHANASHVLKLHQTTTTDDLGAGAVNIESYYTTRWIDAGEPAAIKRWRRPEVILRGGETLQLGVDLWHNYNGATIKRSDTINTEAPTSGDLVWGTGLWGTGVWGGDDTSSEEIHKLSPLGRSRSVRLRFRGPTPSLDWQVDSLALKYIPRRIQG